MGIKRDEPKPAVTDNSAALTAEQAAKPAPVQASQPEVVEVKTTIEENPIPLKPEVNTVTKGDRAVAIVTTTEPVQTGRAPQNIVPDVSSPF